MQIVKLTEVWKKYKYAALVAALGILLMLIPARRGSAAAQTSDGAAGEDTFSLSQTEQKMESILGQMNGVGKLRVMLTLAGGSQLQLASDTDESIGTGTDGDSRLRQEIVRLNKGSGGQEVIVVHQTYPVFQGAVIVCQGADNSAVRLAITEAVSALTGLGADKISIVKWRES